MRKALAAGAAIAAIALATTNGCTVGNGSGSASGDLYVPDCWAGSYNLAPDFFAATPNPNDDTLFIRIQHGSDYINFSDGISILITHVSEVANAITSSGPQTLSISLPPAVVPPGVPITPTANPATAQFALYMQGSCRPETPGLYAMDTVTTNGATASPDGGASLCNADTLTIANQCGVTPVPVVPTGTSTITFQHLFDASLAEGGDPGSLSADKRNIQATFDVLLADPRDECSGGLGPPPPCRGHLTGSFQFYFERGKPAQAFP